MPEFEPTIVAFVCNWCSYAGADKAGGQKLAYSPNVKLVRVMCSGRVDPQFVLQTFREGADGVLVLGCHPGDCHYRTGNIKALRRFRMLQKTVRQFGIDPARLRLDWVAAGESERFQKLAGEMAAAMQALGPLSLTGRVEAEVAG